MTDDTNGMWRRRSVSNDARACHGLEPAGGRAAMGPRGTRLAVRRRAGSAELRRTAVRARVCSHADRSRSAGARLVFAQGRSMVARRYQLRRRIPGTRHIGQVGLTALDMTLIVTEPSSSTARLATR